MPDLRPPRIPRWLLERLLPRGVRGDSIRGDLLEEMSVRARQTSPRAARRWYWAQALRIVIDALVQRRMPDDTSTGRASLMDSLRLDLKFAIRSLLKARRREPHESGRAGTAVQPARNVRLSARAGRGAGTRSHVYRR